MWETDACRRYISGPKFLPSGECVIRVRPPLSELYRISRSLILLYMPPMSRNIRSRSLEAKALTYNLVQFSLKFIEENNFFCLHSIKYFLESRNEGFFLSNKNVVLIFPLSLEFVPGGTTLLIARRLTQNGVLHSEVDNLCYITRHHKF